MVKRIVAPPKVYIDAFEDGLRDRGYVPGRDVEIQYRFAEGREDELTKIVVTFLDQVFHQGNPTAAASR
jgi:hypothetical protein